MATKPSDSYKWGQTSDREQLSGYETAGWPDDLTPPKRKQFNWWQNLVGKWFEWTEDTVDELVTTVLDRWFVDVSGPSEVPNKTGIYKHDIDHRFYLVHNGHMSTVGFNQQYFTASYYTWSGSDWTETSTSLSRANSRNDIQAESETNYVTPKGLVDYIRFRATFVVGGPPNVDGVYIVNDAASGGQGDAAMLRVITDDRMIEINIVDGTSKRYEWLSNAWSEIL